MICSICCSIMAENPPGIRWCERLTRAAPRMGRGHPDLVAP